MKIRIINRLVLGAAVALLGFSSQVTEKSLQHALAADAVSVASPQESALVDLRGRGEKLPVLQKCGKRFGHIFSYCYSQQYFAMHRPVTNAVSRLA